MSEFITPKGGKQKFPFTEEDFILLMQTLGELPVPDDYEEAMHSMSDRALHAAQVAVVAAYHREDGSVVIPPHDVAVLLSKASKYIQENLGGE